MREAFGNIWDMQGDTIVITTNGTVKKNGECVMGRGIALEAKEKYPWIPKYLGSAISLYGNQVYALGAIPSEVDNRGWKYLLSFPVKHNWQEKADLQLIEDSAEGLFEMAKALDLKDILVPRPGCGNGQLSWEDVKPILETYFDDRFIMVTK